VSNRWERILDQKPVRLEEHLISEAARLLLGELGRWPLPVEEIDAMTGGGMVELLRPDAPRPSPAVFPAALQLVRWELGREHEAYDEYMRNRRYQEAGIPEADRPALLLVSRWVLEQLLSLSDATGGRVNRHSLISLVDRLERGLRTAGEVPEG
jgi:hypothetical protein